METKVLNRESAVKYSWLSMVIGMVTLLLGVVSIFVSNATFFSMGVWFVAAIAVCGLCDLILGFVNRKTVGGTGLTIAMGGFEVLLCVTMLLFSNATLTSLYPYLLGGWMLVRSAWMIYKYLGLRKTEAGAGLFILLMAVLTPLCALLFIVLPLFGSAFNSLLLGFAIAAYGVFRILYSMRLKEDDIQP